MNTQRRDQTSLRTTGSPGTARCLRGMALSLEGSEPIQSALTLPMPAGRVFMSQTACQQNSLREPLSGADAVPVTHSRAHPTGKNHRSSSCNVTVTLHTGLPPAQNAPPTRIKSSVTRSLVRFPVGYCNVVALRCVSTCKPGTH